MALVRAGWVLTIALVSAVVGPVPVNADPPAARPAPEGLATSLVLTPLELRPAQAGGNREPLESVAGWIPAGQGGDFFWMWGRDAYVETHGKFQRVSTSRPSHFGRACFDGRYVWLPVVEHNQQRSPYFFLIDTTDGKVRELAERDGIPVPRPDDRRTMVTPAIAVTDLAPGKVCAAGSKNRLCWVALLTVNADGKLNVERLLEPDQAIKPEDYPKDVSKNTAIWFTPQYMVTLRAPAAEGAKPETRVLLGRQGGNSSVMSHPLLIDPETKKVDVLADEVDLETPECFAVHDGAVYWARPGRRRAKGPGVSIDLWRVGFPGPRKTRVAQDVCGKAPYRHTVAFDQNRTYVVGDAVWGAEAPEGPFRRLSRRFRSLPETTPAQVAFSQAHGLVLLRAGYAPDRLVPQPGALADNESDVIEFEPRKEQPTVTRAFLVKEKGAVRTLVLHHAKEPDVFEAGVDRGLLTREFFRQALLIAARDGLGLATRDALLGEASDEVPEGEHVELELASLIVDKAVARVSLRRVGAAPKLLLAEEMRLSEGLFRDIRSPMTLAMNAMPDRMVEALKAAGCVGRSNVHKRDGALPDGVADRLERLNLTDQLAVLRLTHAAIRKDGESPERLGALVRAYAQLGVLTEHHWNAAHKGLKARALLYARKIPGSWHQAFAESLVGLHADALRSLAAARQRPNGLARPDWADLIEAACKFDLEGLTVPARHPHAELAALLKFIAVEHSNSTTLIVKTGEEALKVNPDNFRVLDSLCPNGGISVKHFATTAALERFSAMLPKRLLDVPDLADLVAPVLGANDEPKLVQTLLDASAPGKDAGEPSWGLLGQMIQEARFTQCWRRLMFMRDVWNVPVGDFLPTALLMTARHPYRKYLETFRDDANDPRDTAARLRAITVRDPELTEHFLIYIRDQLVPRPSWSLYGVARTHVDPVARDLSVLVSNPRIEGVGYEARQLFEESPNSPVARAAVVKFDWAFAERFGGHWEQESPGHPEVLDALAHHYEGLKRFDDAERCLRAYVRIAPDGPAYEALAALCERRGDLEVWRNTLDEYLKTPEQGLDHMRIRVAIANRLMRDGKDKEAQPYADAAAETGAAAGMKCAAECCEKVGDLAGAALWHKRLTQRYGGIYGLRWFVFCVRTNSDELPRAREIAADWVDAVGVRGGYDERTAAAFYFMATKQPRKALEQRQWLAKDRPGPYDALHLVLLYDELGEPALRDETIEQILKAPNAGPPFAPFAELLRTWFAGGKDAAFDQKTFDGLVEQCGDNDRPVLLFFAGHLLHTRGKGELAIRYLLRCVREKTVPPVERNIAIAILRERGVEFPVKDDQKHVERYGPRRQGVRNAHTISRITCPSTNVSRSSRPRLGVRQPVLIESELEGCGMDVADAPYSVWRPFFTAWGVSGLGLG